MRPRGMWGAQQLLRSTCQSTTGSEKAPFQIRMDPNSTVLEDPDPGRPKKFWKGLEANKDGNPFLGVEKARCVVSWCNFLTKFFQIFLQ
jgi:hypothetical protein